MNPEAPDNVILTTLDDAINWGRDNSLCPTFFGTSCCFAEIMTGMTSRFNLDRFGAEARRMSPHDSNLLLIAGTPCKKIGATILRLYEQMPDPKWVVAIGDCANSGGMYDVYSVIQGIGQILPVDIYIPGCPPRPEALIQGLEQLQDKIISNEQPGSRPALAHQNKSSGTGTPNPVTSQQQQMKNELPDKIIPPQPKVTFPNGSKGTANQLHERFEGRVKVDQDSVDMPGFIATVADLPDLLKYLKKGNRIKYARLEDITAVDERSRRSRPEHDFTLIYHLLSLQVPGYIRIKVPLTGETPEAPSITSLWPSAVWYEREVYDMFGIRFIGHPDLRRILMPQEWIGFPLRKEHVSQATEMAPFTAETARSMVSLPTDNFFNEKVTETTETVILNIGPYHPGTHGVLRLMANLDGEKIVDVEADIGYQHRGVEKIGERLQWNQFLPYTDRIDYLSGVQNNLAYLHSIETLIGVTIPPRAESIRILLSELFRIANHLAWLGSFAHDIGLKNPSLYAFKSREKILNIVEIITGRRMHPAWFCIGGVQENLPDGWGQAVDTFTHDFDFQRDELEKLLTDDPLFREKTEGIGVINSQTAVDWGITGPNLRAAGIPWDVRRAIPYGGYDRFDFDVVTAEHGDCFARYLVRMGEMRESLKIVRQATATMPGGQWLAVNAEELQFDTVSHAAVPKGECYRAIEASKGECGYYAVSDGGSTPYRLHIRTPSFPHLQAMSKITKDSRLTNLTTILGSVDFLLSDLDR